VVSLAFPLPARAAWVNNAGTQFQVAGKLSEITPTAAGTTFVGPTCGSQGGTSLGIVSGMLTGVDPLLYPIVLVVSCLDNGSNATIRSRLNFITPVAVVPTPGTIVAAGTVLKQLTTKIASVAAAPSNGWAHLVHRPDKGDLLGCGANGAIYSIDYSPLNSTTDGAATPLTPLPSVITSCTGLAWDAQADTIYVGLSVSGGTKIGRVVSFKEGQTTLVSDLTNLPCVASGMAISGGVLLMSCSGALTIQRLDKMSQPGASLGVFPILTATGLTSLSNDPGLGDFACDPVTFKKGGSSTSDLAVTAGRDMYRDALWSRRGVNGNGVAALEFPAFTCGMPLDSVVTTSGVRYSPLAAGLSAPSGTQRGALPRTGCFDSNGIVIDTDRDGLPDCWETSGIDFDGDGTVDLQLCVQVNTNGDGVTLTTECADPLRKDLFVEIDYMQFHKPDPKALSQQSVSSNGVQSIREAFAAAPVPVCELITPPNPLCTSVATATGIRLHTQVDEQPVTFTPSVGSLTSHVNLVALTPCTGPTSFVSDQSQVADFDAIKAVNIGVAAERNITDLVQRAKALDAKRLAFRYVLFGHSQVGTSNPNTGVNSSGCAEVGGDDAIVTLGSFATPGSDNSGPTDYQAGTLMHEVGHLLGLRHGGDDELNCKPNYRSVMSYPRQLPGSPITGRRLDYSRHQDLDLDETNLNECAGIGFDSTLGPIPNGCVAGLNCYFSSADQIAFGPGTWSLVTPWPPATTPPGDGCTTSGPAPINWNRVRAQGNTYQTLTSADINGGATTGCDISGALIPPLGGFDDWSNLLYRASASLAFAGGALNDSPKEMTKENEAEFFRLKDADGHGVGDAIDCGGTPTSEGSTTNSCTHRIDIKPSFPFPKTLNLGTESNVTIAIFSEQGALPGASGVWSAPNQVIVNDQVNYPLTFSVGSIVEPVKTNQSGQGTCSISDVDDPDPQIGKDGIKDLKCQFPTTGLPTGTFFGIVSGFFSDPLDPASTPNNPVIKAFSARQAITLLP
jgi:hypothetical protein